MLCHNNLERMHSMETVRFNELVEDIRSLTTEEKEEIKFLVERYLIEERREDIYKNYQDSIKEFKKGKLVFSDKIDELKTMIEQ